MSKLNRKKRKVKKLLFIYKNTAKGFPEHGRRKVNFIKALEGLEAMLVKRGIDPKEIQLWKFPRAIWKNIGAFALYAETRSRRRGRFKSIVAGRVGN